jgi:hypothetical protein
MQEPKRLNARLIAATAIACMFVAIFSAFKNKSSKAKPTPAEALEAITGEKTIDAAAILEYFAPLKKWLDEQNAASGPNPG